MFNLDRFQKIFTLGFFFTFFLYTFTFMITLFLNNIIFLLDNTFLDLYGELVGTILIVILTLIKYLSLMFLVCCIVGLIVIFYNDTLVKQVKNDTM